MDLPPGRAHVTAADPPAPSAPSVSGGREALPVAATERVRSVDVLRGAALLGILVMNVVAYALPDAAYANPTAGGGFEGEDRAAWLVSHLFFEMKMMTVFSMLFGAGLVLMAERGEARGALVRRTYFRRILWLLLIGLMHSYLLWWGDILVAYAECGLLLWFFRRWPPRALILTGAALSLVGVVMMFAIGTFMGGKRDAAEAAGTAEAAGRMISGDERRAIQAWDDARRDMAPSPEQVAENAAVYEKGWAAIAEHRAPTVLMMHTAAFVIMLVWRVGGTMLIGMGLMKLGVFSASRSDRFYGGCIAVGYGLGLPLVGWGATGLIAHGFDFAWVMRGGGLPNYFGSFLVAMGHVGLVMTAVRRGMLVALQRRLAAVGQMALTNYLAQSLICTTLFYGYGFGLFGELSRAELLGVVVAIWVVQLAWSPWWLDRFRFGPAEWLWRSLTYGHVQPMRAGASGPARAA